MFRMISRLFKFGVIAAPIIKKGYSKYKAKKRPTDTTR